MSADKISERSTSVRKSLGGKSVTLKHRRTPYSNRTPRSRELRTEASHSDTSLTGKQRSLQLQDAGLTFKSWRTYRMTTLFNFCYTREKLKEYAQYLSSCIEKEKKKNVGVLVSHETNCKITFSILDDVHLSQADSKAVLITIADKATNENAKPLFSGVLLSVERSRELWEHKLKKNDFTVLPLLLAGGAQFFVKTVIKFLEQHFVCVVQPLTFSVFHLTWMLAMWAGDETGAGTKPLLLKYSLPLQDLHTIEYSIRANSVFNIWSSIHDPNSNEMDIDEVNAFILCLERHFRAIFSIDLSHLQLTAIGTPAAAVHRNGIVKILNNSAVPHVLRHLTSLAQELAVS